MSMEESRFVKMWSNDVYDIGLFEISDVNYEMLVRSFGEPGAESDQYDDAPGPAKYWCLEYPCGLKVILQWHVTKDIVIVHADRFEHAHVKRHLAPNLSFEGAWSNQSQEADMFEWMARHEKLRPFFAFDKSWLVERIDDNANTFTVEENLTERAAKCIAASLEATGHKQSYNAKQKRTTP